MTPETSNNKLHLVIVVLSIAIVLMAVVLYSRPIAISGQTEEHTIVVSGSAEKSVAPDTASLSIGVVVQAPTSKEASDENAVLMNAVINELKDIGLPDKDIQTSYLSVYPVYNYSRDGVPTIEAYSASNNVQVTTEMLDMLGDIIDRSAAAGANQIGGVSFSVSQEKQKEYRQELLADAVNDASLNANQLADGLDVKIVGVKTSSISEGWYPRTYYAAAAAGEERAAAPIIEPGETTVSLSVQVTYVVE
ncbi:MAG: SIMPL domain-containing protein [Methanosarcinaceae archaeon]|nr:SIMPL domain-containing protein [Methanosarcinaceae archaeon]